MPPSSGLQNAPFSQSTSPVMLKNLRVFLQVWRFLGQEVVLREAVWAWRLRGPDSSLEDDHRRVEWGQRWQRHHGNASPVNTAVRMQLSSVASCDLIISAIIHTTCFLIAAADWTSWPMLCGKTSIKFSASLIQSWRLQMRLSKSAPRQSSMKPLEINHMLYTLHCIITLVAFGMRSYPGTSVLKGKYNFKC